MNRAFLLGLGLLTLWPHAPAGAADEACIAENGVAYSVAEIFPPRHACASAYANSCPKLGSICANIALFKLANYQSETYQDLLFTPHRGTWGSTFGSKDPGHNTAPAQNTIAAVDLATSFATAYSVNKEGKNYKSVLRGRGQELDVTTIGNNTSDGPMAIMNHYMTTADTVTGTLYDYLMNWSWARFDSFDGKIENRDFSESNYTLRGSSLAFVTDDYIDPGVLAFLDVKAIRGTINCQTENLQPGTPAYEANNCKYNTKPYSTQIDLATQRLAAETVYTSGGEENVVIKSHATYDEARQAFGDTLEAYMWQPHVQKSMGPEKAVQYIHDWLVNAPRSVIAWEMNIYAPGDPTTDTPFCVTEYIPPGSAPPEYPYGQVKVEVNPSSPAMCMEVAGGVMENMLDYLRHNTGNPDYFGFDQKMRSQGLYSGNRANLWLMETIAPAGTADRYYRWQMLGSDETYTLADPVKTVHYPYAAYAILTGDRMESVRQILEKKLYPRWGGPDDAKGEVLPRGE